MRAQAFVNGTATGAPGAAMYVARSFDAQHDLPLMLIDDYGRGKPGRDYVDAAAMVFETAGGRTSLAGTPAVASRAGIHLRGQSSATFDKAPYRLELRDNADGDADLPLLGMPADADWVLRGPFSDKSLIREALVYDLGREMGMATPRYRFVELYLNVDAAPLAAADYQGVYMLVETIKNSKDRLDLKQLDEDDTTLPKITGGYLVKFEWLAAEEPTLTCTGPAATCWNYLEVAAPSWSRPSPSRSADPCRKPPRRGQPGAGRPARDAGVPAAGQLDFDLSVGGADLRALDELVAGALELLGEPQEGGPAHQDVLVALADQRRQLAERRRALAVVAGQLRDQRHLAGAEARQAGVEDEVARVLVVVVVVDGDADVVQHRRGPQQLALHRVAVVDAGGGQPVEHLEREVRDVRRRARGRPRTGARG